MEIVLPVQDESFNRQLATVLQDQLGQLGVGVEVQILDRGTFFSTIQSGEPDAYIFYYLWPVPIDVVTLFVGSATIPNPNYANASIPEVDAAIEPGKTLRTRKSLRPQARNSSSPWRNCCRRYL